MRINFRQGIISYPTSGNAQSFLVKAGSNVNLQAGTVSVNVSLSYKDTEYLLTETTDVPSAWSAIPAATDCWLYWDINMRTGVRTFGFTLVQPIADDEQPLGVEDLHWYDTLNNVHYLYTNGAFREVVRVFAAKINTNTFFPLGVGFPSLPYAGSQVGDYTPNTSTGHIIADTVGAPIRRSNGAFFTTESDFFVNGTVVNPIRLEATVITGTALETIAKFQVVKFSQFGKLNLAGYNDIQTTMIAMGMDDLVWEQVGSVCVQGLITNPTWNWTTVGAPLWVSEAGLLTETDPHVSNALIYPVGKPPIGRVITPTSIFFDQGLGGKGDRGEKGLSGGVQFADAVTYGVTRMSVAPAAFETPIAVGDNDPRLSNKVLKAGDTMTGPLVFTGGSSQITLPNAPTVGGHATNKTYVDLTISTAISGIDLSTRVAKSGDTMTGLLVLSADPVVALGAATKQYVDTAIGAVNVPYDLSLACSDTTNAIAIKTNAALAIAPRTFTLTLIRGDLLTASSVGSVVAQVLVNGSVIETLTITATTTSIAVANTTVINYSDRITVNITGAGTGAIALLVTLQGVA